MLLVGYKNHILVNKDLFSRLKINFMTFAILCFLLRVKLKVCMSIIHIKYVSSTHLLALDSSNSHAIRFMR